RKGQGRGKTRVTEEPKPVGAGLTPFKSSATGLHAFLASSPCTISFCLVGLSPLYKRSRVYREFDLLGSAIMHWSKTSSLHRETIGDVIQLATLSRMRECGNRLLV